MLKKEPSIEVIDMIRKLVKNNKLSIASDYIKNLQPEDLAPILDSLPLDAKSKLFKLLNDEIIREIILEIEEASLRQLLKHINIKRLVAIIEPMESDDAADVVGMLPENLKKSVLDNISEEDAKDVKTLLKYPEDTAGGLMQLEFVSVNEHLTINEAISAIKELEDETIDFHNIFVVDSENRPTGILPISKIILEKPNVPVKKIMEDISVKIHVNLDQEEVAIYFRKFHEISLPVVDDEEKLIGRIMVDDIVDVIEEEASEDMLKMAGTDDEELLFSTSIFQATRLRLPWIIASLIGGISTGLLLWQFKVTLETVLTLAVFIPVITGMGGNVGTQSSSITVRGLATGRINLSYVMWHIKREILTGLTMGVICGLFVGVFAQLWADINYLGYIVGISMFFAISAASLMGTLLPLFFKKVNIDPALASGPFVTTANDLTGLLIYFALATIMIKHLG